MSDNVQEIINRFESEMQDVEIPEEVEPSDDVEIRVPKDTYEISEKDKDYLNRLREAYFKAIKNQGDYVPGSMVTYSTTTTSSDDVFDESVW